MDWKVSITGEQMYIIVHSIIQCNEGTEQLWKGSRLQLQMQSHARYNFKCHRDDGFQLWDALHRYVEGVVQFAYPSDQANVFFQKYSFVGCCKNKLASSKLR